MAVSSVHSDGSENKSNTAFLCSTVDGNKVDCCSFASVMAHVCTPQQQLHDTGNPVAHIFQTEREFACCCVNHIVYSCSYTLVFDTSAILDFLF